MPVYNGAEYVREAIDSILAQTMTDLELVICDNASTDATPAICRAYEARDPRVRYFLNDRNLGAHPNYNRTFRESSGEYFKWAAHDDVLKPGFLAACVSALEARPEAVLAQTLIEYVDGDGRPIGAYDSALRAAAGPDPVRRFAAAVLEPHPAYEVMGLFRRSVLEDSILLRSFHGADRALLADVVLRGEVARVDEPLLVVRDHARRYTRSHVRPRERATWHDSSLKGRASFPAWSLYREYRRAVRRHLRGRDLRRARRVLVAWWFQNYNGVRMAVDLAALGVPGIIGWAERAKQTLISPAPGPDEVRARLRDSRG
jgi:glycosyltransferase involved in cell wall biosynthesis